MEEPDLSETARPDHFSRVAGHYASARPTYPHALFEWLASVCPRRCLAVDVGAGTGLATVALARHFDRVVGTDLSDRQIANAQHAPNVEYMVSPAEHLPFGDASVDLLTVAQALHWFDLDRFWPEVKRVLQSRGVVAVWTYGLLSVAGAEVDAVVQDFYRNVAGPWWPPGREHVENGYSDLSFPFAPMPVPSFHMSVHWDLPAFLNYVRSWSATGALTEKTGADPVPRLEKDLQELWGSAREVSWPLGLRAGTLA